jgi:hypothetical protein
LANSIRARLFQIGIWFAEFQLSIEHFFFFLIKTGILHEKI